MDLFIFIQHLKKIKNYLRCEFTKETETTTKFAYADLIAGQNKYKLPADTREIFEISLNKKNDQP